MTTVICMLVGFGVWAISIEYRLGEEIKERKQFNDLDNNQLEDIEESLDLCRDNIVTNFTNTEKKINALAEATGHRYIPEMDAMRHIPAHYEKVSKKK